MPQSLLSFLLKIIANQDIFLQGEHSTPVHPQKTTYITVENTSGELEQLKVMVDEMAFGTTTPILQYLQEHGEISLTPDKPPVSDQKIAEEGDGQLLPPSLQMEGMQSPGKFKLPRRGLSRGSSMFNVLQKMTGNQFGTPTNASFRNKNVAFGELKTMETTTQGSTSLDPNCFDLEHRGSKIAQHEKSSNAVF